MANELKRHPTSVDYLSNNTSALYFRPESCSNSVGNGVDGNIDFTTERVNSTSYLQTGKYESLVVNSYLGGANNVEFSLFKNGVIVGLQFLVIGTGVTENIYDEPIAVMDWFILKRRGQTSSAMYFFIGSKVYLDE